MAIGSEEIQACVQGAYDMHVHGAPDVMARKADDIELAEMAKAAKMGGLLYKSHHVPTADRATLVKKMVEGIEIFGAITLNNFVGGINPQAVDVAARLGAKLVWMPTVDARNEQGKLTQADETKLPYWAKIQRELLAAGYLRDPIDIRTSSGEFTKETMEVLEVMAHYDMILATGHLAPHESIEVVKEARKLGIKRIVITHPEFPTTTFSLEQQLELLAYGVFFERCFTTPNTGKVSWEKVFHDVRATGPENNILSTDLGQPTALYPVEGYAKFVEAFLNNGFSVAEVRKMTVKNPYGLLH